MPLNVINPYQTFRGSTGRPRASGWVSFFVNTTAVLDTIYSDDDLTVTQTNPYQLDAYGRIKGDVKYAGLMTLQETNEDGSDVITTDNVTTINKSLSVSTYMETLLDDADAATARATLETEYDNAGHIIANSMFHNG